jgi:hypothetical protein
MGVLDEGGMGKFLVSLFLNTITKTAMDIYLNLI